MRRRASELTESIDDATIQSICHNSADAQLVTETEYLLAISSTSLPANV